MIHIKTSTTKVDYKQILDFENQYNICFPDDYKNFLLKYNGGKPDENIIRIGTEEVTELAVLEFYGIGLETYNDLPHIFQLFFNRVPDNTIPIACDYFGNKFLLSINNDTYGYIFFWDHEDEFELEEKGNRIEDLLLISKSFDEFISLLQPTSYFTQSPINDVNHTSKAKITYIDVDFFNNLKKEREKKD